MRVWVIVASLVRPGSAVNRKGSVPGPVPVPVGGDVYVLLPARFGSHKDGTLIGSDESERRGAQLAGCHP